MLQSIEYWILLVLPCGNGPVERKASDVGAPGLWSTTGMGTQNGLSFTCRIRSTRIQGGKASSRTNQLADRLPYRVPTILGDPYNYWSLCTLPPANDPPTAACSTECRRANGCLNADLSQRLPEGRSRPLVGRASISVSGILNWSNAWNTLDRTENFFP